MEEQFTMPKLSFVVISHNFEKYIFDCLNSIKNQSYKNFEIIVIDDFSSDKTCDIVRDFANENKNLNFKFIKNKKSFGQLASFLIALEEVSGEFVAQIDGDDVLFEDYTKVHIEAHLKTSVALTSCKHINIDDNNVVHSLASIECPQKEETKFDLSKSSLETDLKTILIAEKEADFDVEVLSNDKYSFATWHWAPTSSGVLRTSTAKLLLKLKNPQKIKITADKFVFSFAHLIGSSAIIHRSLYAYRKHSTNYSLANPVLGSKRYLKPKTQANYIRNNRLIRQEMFIFFAQNYRFFVEHFNQANVMLIFKKIIFSIDINTLKSAFKSLFIFVK